MKSIMRKMPILGALLALVCAFAVDAAEAKTAPKKSPAKKSVATTKKRTAAVVNHPLGRLTNPKAPEYYGYPKPRPIYSNYRIDGNIPNAAYYGNTYGYSYGPRTIPYPNSSYQQQTSPEYLMKYSQYVQQYNRSNDMPPPYGFTPNSYPNNRYDSAISQRERWERDRVYSAQVALHALLLRYGTREGGERFPDREKLTQEAIRYADLLRYGMTHTYTNPETNIAP